MYLVIPYDLTDTYSTLQGGLTLLLINLSNSTVNVASNLLSHSKDKPKSHGKKPNSFKTSIPPVPRSEYHLTPQHKDLHSQTALLNGVPLELTSTGDLPNMEPIVREKFSPVSVAPLSIVFVVYPHAQVPLCIQSGS